MFETALKERLTRIFDFKKVTYDSPSESKEQEGMFIRVDSAKSKISDKIQRCKVMGKVFVFANADKLPYGYFNKCIRQADHADTKDIFFYEFEENRGGLLNIVERSFSFLYLFESQFDPDLGEINEVNLEITTNL